jgi:hypothetical protein
MLPGGAVARLLPTGADGIAVGAYGAGKTLEETRRLPPLLPQMAFLPWRATIKSPPSSHSQEACPCSAVDGSGRNDAAEISISHSPTGISRSMSAGFGPVEFIFTIIIPFLL